MALNRSSKQSGKNIGATRKIYFEFLP